jgi:HK97 family phage major capsid protein
MSRIKHLKELRGSKLKELDTLRTGAEKRAFTKEESEKFDALETEVRGINADLEREERANNLATAQGSVEQRNGGADERLGLSEKEIRGYSLIRAIGCLIEGRKLDGLEAEASQAEAKRLGKDPTGFFVPFEVMARGVVSERERRANAVGTAADGGYLVGASIDYANMVQLLRNQSHVLSLGARVIPGLVGDVAIPRVLTGATAYWVSETGSIAQSSATFGQVAMKPKRLGASVPYSKQFLNQSGIGAEMFVRDDIFGAFGVELDRVAINGAGGSEPLGILNLASGDRATGVTFGAAPTWAKVVSFETNVETANALGLAGGPYAYLTTPGVKGAWKTTSKVANTASFLWENGDLVNGYTARSTNQVPSDKVIYGQFGQVIYGEWAGIDLTVDALTAARTGQVIVTMQKFVDMVIRQGKAFSVSSDSGKQ